MQFVSTHLFACSIPFVEIILRSINIIFVGFLLCSFPLLLSYFSFFFEVVSMKIEKFTTERAEISVLNFLFRKTICMRNTQKNCCSCWFSLCIYLKYEQWNYSIFVLFFERMRKFHLVMRFLTLMQIHCKYFWRKWNV